jgi:hypothetical protein
MKVKLMLVVGAMCVVMTAGDVFGMAWGDSRHRRGTVNGNGNGSSGSSSSSGSSHHSVPEPSSLYALGSALALLGSAGWVLRRK